MDFPHLCRPFDGRGVQRAVPRQPGEGANGLSVAFDLPTQTGYDSDHPLAKGEVGKVGVPISHLGDMRTLFDGIPLDQMNTSMTINATAPWLLALYVALADEQGAARDALTGTVQNDILKEYLSRGTYVFPPEPSLRLIKDVIAYAWRDVPKWNPTTPARTTCRRPARRRCRSWPSRWRSPSPCWTRCALRGEVSEEEFPEVVGRMSFFVNAGTRFITEMSKMRAFVDLWDEICRERYGVEDPKKRRFRYGVQVNSLGLTEQQPENNPYRILCRCWPSRCRSAPAPAPSSFRRGTRRSGLPRPWDQQWSLRLQQILAYETDLLEYGDLFDGSQVIEARSRR